MGQGLGRICRAESTMPLGTTALRFEYVGRGFQSRAQRQGLLGEAARPSHLRNEMSVVTTG